MTLTINNPTTLGFNTADATAQTNISRLYTGSASVGDLVLASVAFGLGSTPTSMTVSDDAGNTFTLAEQADRLTGNTPHVWLYYCVLTHAVTSANRLTITPSSSFNFPVMDIGKATVTGGTWNASPVDKIAANTGSSTSPSSGATATTTQANELVFGAICTGSPQTVTWTNSNTGLLHSSDSTKALDTGYQVLTGTGTPQASGTITSADWAAVVATFKATASSAPTNTVAPAVTGTATVGSVLTTTNGTWTDNGSPAFSYQWQRDVAGNGVYSNISSATSSTYTLVSADDTCHVRCVVTDTDANGATPANSNATAVVTFPVPVVSVAPVVSGGAPVGSVLSTTNGTWTNSPTSFSYQWTRDGSNIAAATSSTYTTIAGDVTHAVGCKVVATNDGGNSAASASNTITVTAAAVGAAPNRLQIDIGIHI